jgi:CubicO group peptidase (beta-lactamase class C family)
MTSVSRLIGIGCLMCAVVGLSACGNLSSNIVAANRAELDALYARHYDLQELADKLARPLTDSGENVGIVIGVLDESGGRHVYSYGRKSLASSERPDGDTIFAIGSLTKPIVTMLLNELIADGTIDPAETVGEILPEQTEFTPAAKAITLYQLANHASGLPRQPINFTMFKSLVHYAFTGDNIYRHLDKAALYSYLSEFDPDADEVDTYHYSNIGLGLLGHLLEVKTGKSLSALLSERMFRPLGLADTGYALDPTKAPRLAMGYVGMSPFFLPRNTPMPYWEMDDTLKGAAGLYSTANDLLTFAQYRIGLDGIPIVNVPVSRGLFDFGKPQLHAVSLGWDIDEFEDNERIIFQHGMIAGFTAYLGIEQEKRLAVVVLYNNFDWDDQIGHTLLLTLARGSAGATAQRAAVLQASRPERSPGE